MTMANPLYNTCCCLNVETAGGAHRHSANMRPGFFARGDDRLDHIAGLKSLYLFLAH